MINPIGYVRGWWDDYCDRYNDNHGWRDTTEKVPFGKLRWWIAEWYNKHTSRCWSEMAEFAMGWTLNLRGKDTTRCREEALRIGTCYCGKYINKEVADTCPANMHMRTVVNP